MDQRTLKNIWNQKLVPVVLRRTREGDRLRARLPKRSATTEFGFETGAGHYLSGSATTAPVGNCQRLGSTILLIARCFDMGASTLSNLTASGRNVHRHARMLSVTNVSAHAWANITEPATMGVGSRYPIPLQHAGAIENSHAGY